VARMFIQAGAASGRPRPGQARKCSPRPGRGDGAVYDAALVSGNAGEQGDADDVPERPQTVPGPAVLVGWNGSRCAAARQRRRSMMTSVMPDSGMARAIVATTLPTFIRDQHFGSGLSCSYRSKAWCSCLV
jgi:hypothetical protein